MDIMKEYIAPSTKIYCSCHIRLLAGSGGNRLYSTETTTEVITDGNSNTGGNAGQAAAKFNSLFADEDKED
jgi:hypothetical protein